MTNSFYSNRTTKLTFFSVSLVCASLIALYLQPIKQYLNNGILL